MGHKTAFAHELEADRAIPVNCDLRHRGVVELETKPTGRIDLHHSRHKIADHVRMTDDDQGTKSEFKPSSLSDGHFCFFWILQQEFQIGISEFHPSKNSERNGKHKIGKNSGFVLNSENFTFLFRTLDDDRGFGSMSAMNESFEGVFDSRSVFCDHFFNPLTSVLGCNFMVYIQWLDLMGAALFQQAGRIHILLIHVELIQYNMCGFRRAYQCLKEKVKREEVCSITPKMFKIGIKQIGVQFTKIY